MKQIIDTSAIKKILITRTDRIGDLVLSTPVFASLKEHFPAARISVVILPGTREVLEGNPHVDSVYIYDKRGKHKSLLNSLFFFFSLRKEKFDCAIHLHPTNRVHMLSFFAGIPIRIGYKRKMHQLLTRSFDERKRSGQEHESVYNYDLLAPLKVDRPKTLKPLFVVRDEDHASLDRVLQQKNISLHSFVCLFPSASCPSKMWSPERFAELAKVLHDIYGQQIVLIGGPDACDHAKKVAKLADTTCTDLVGQLSLKQLGALFMRAALVVSNDSGPAHIAASLDVPIISLFGRNDPGLSPQRWRPLGDKSYYLHKNSGCPQCLAHDCDKGFRCLQSITVDDVVCLIRANNLLTPSKQ